jgi:hypothetical protein
MYDAGMRFAAILLAVSACGQVNSVIDARPIDSPHGGGDAPPPDASIDAPASNMVINSVQQFPTPHTTITDFTMAEFTADGVSGTGFNQGGGGLGGNVDAPTNGAFAGMSATTQHPTFTFTQPIHAAGFSTMDIDFGNDNIVNVTVDGLDAMNNVVMTHHRGIAPANTAAEEDAGALFIGWKTSSAVVTVRVTIDQANSTLLDNFVFAH